MLESCNPKIGLAVCNAGREEGGPLSLPLLFFHPSILHSFIVICWTRTTDGRTRTRTDAALLPYFPKQCPESPAAAAAAAAGERRGERRRRRRNENRCIASFGGGGGGGGLEEARRSGGLISLRGAEIEGGSSKRRDIRTYLYQNHAGVECRNAPLIEHKTVSYSENGNIFHTFSVPHNSFSSAAPHMPLLARALSAFLRPTNFVCMAWPSILPLPLSLSPSLPPSFRSFARPSDCTTNEGSGGRGREGREFYFGGSYFRPLISFCRK